MSVRPMLLHRMALVSFRLFCTNLGNLQELSGQMVYRPPGRKLPVRLYVYMACLGGSYDTQNCCPNQTDSQTKVKLVSNWYEPKIDNLQRQSKKPDQ